MDSYGYSFLAAAIMIVFGQPLMAGVCFVAGIVAANIPRKRK